MSFKEELRSKLQEMILTSNNLEEELTNLIIEYAKDVHQVDMYNIFYKFLQKADKKGDTVIYEALACIMDMIWSGNTEQVEIYANVLTDEDFKARESSRRMFSNRRNN